ncbi:MAG: ATP-binding protein, partial [Anaerolineae bacterium]
MFIDRGDELAHLERSYGSGRAELYVLYGRRRVGKTELLRAFCQGKRHLFFIATLSSDGEQLAAFSQEIWRFSHESVADGFTFPSWEAAFRALADLPGRPVVVLDEFTYLISGNKAIPSILQKVWDESLRHTHLMLVLCGSYVGLMEREVLGYHGPLYGRRTASYLLQPLELPAATAFFPAYSPVEKIEAWAVLGGIPYYLEFFSDQVSVVANIREHILETRGALHREPQLLLAEELREPRNYFSILRAIAQGAGRLSEIIQAAAVGDSSTTSRYLDVLQELRIVKRIVPATESQPQKSKKGLYRIEDPFMRFWFRYVHPNQGALEIGLTESVLEQRLRPTFAQFVSYAFEEAAREYVVRLARAGHLPFLPERVGAWWDAHEEIDIIAVSDSERAILFGECKWWMDQVGLNVLLDLKRKSRITNVSGRWTQEHYALFSKSGFTPELRAVANCED